MTEDAALIARVAGYVQRECHHPALTRDDLVQEGWLAMLEAEAAGRVPGIGPHRAAYLAVRTSGAMRDARRRAMLEVPAGDAEAPEDGHDPTPDVIDAVHVRRQLERFSARREATPAMREVLHALLAGRTLREIARDRACTTSAVLQIARRVEWLMAMLR